MKDKFDEYSLDSNEHKLNSDEDFEYEIEKSKNYFKRNKLPKKWNDFKKIKNKNIGYEIGISISKKHWVFGKIISIIYEENEDGIIEKNIKIKLILSIKIKSGKIYVKEKSNIIYIGNIFNNILYLHKNPFRSEKQRRYLWMFHPEIAKVNIYY